MRQGGDHSKKNNFVLVLRYGGTHWPEERMLPQIAAGSWLDDERRNDVDGTRGTCWNIHSHLMFVGKLFLYQKTKEPNVEMPIVFLKFIAFIVSSGLAWVGITI